MGTIFETDIESEESGSEEEVAHELRLDGKAVRVGEAEGIISAAETKESGVAADTENVEETLEPTKQTNNGGRGEEDF